MTRELNLVFRLFLRIKGRGFAPMNDPFRHIETARHFLNVNQKRLAAAKTAVEKGVWQDAIVRIKADISKMERWEHEFWASL